MTDELAVRRTPIPGLLVVDLPVHADNRGWFKENWQREKMVALGLPDFAPVQNNISFNAHAGATRGIHAEPWDKLVSVATGQVFGAWVDLREGPSFGKTFTLEVGPESAVFVPRGVGNGFQTLSDGTAYSYLVNEHWTPEARESYTFINVADETLEIAWPISLADAELSAADRAHPSLADVTPFAAPRTLVLGARGQVGQALLKAIPGSEPGSRDELDLTDAAAIEDFPWQRYDTVVNAAAFTDVDGAETEDGRRSAWATNVVAVGRLAQAATRHRFTLVHISSDYVFDGSLHAHTEDDALSPLGVYGQTKAAGDLLAMTTPRHYVIRCSWVIGSGKNFVRTMAALADRGINPSVIDDQVGRLTFAPDIAQGIVHLLQTSATPGVYNLTSSGPGMSWADVATVVFRARGRDESDVQRVSTAVYTADKTVAPRPLSSVLDLSKIESAGFVPPDGRERLADYLTKEG